MKWEIVVLSLISCLSVAQQVNEADDVSFVIGVFLETIVNPSNIDRFLTSPAFVGQQFRSDEPWRKAPGLPNKKGKLQAFSFGQFLRRRYARFFTIAKDEILDYEIAKAFSSSSQGNQATLQLVLASLLPITDNDITWNNGNSTGQWQPYPYNIDDKLTSPVDANCLELKRRFDQFKNDSAPEVQEWLSDDRRVAGATFAVRTGLNASLTSLADFGEFLQALQTYNATLPPWLLEPTKPLPPNVSQFSNISSTSTPKSNPPSFLSREPPLWMKLLQFRRVHSQLCADDAECRRLVSGYFLNHILQVLMLKKEGKLPERKVHLYSVSPETVFALAALLQVRMTEDARRPNFLSPLNGLIIEYRENPTPAIRILLHESPVGDSSVVSTRLLDTAYCPRQEWCRMDIVIRSVGLDTVDDWEKACKTPTGQCVPSGGTSVALVRDAQTENDAAFPVEKGKKLKSTECSFEWDKSGARPCRNWAAYGYCNLYDSVRWLFCRRTCLCNPEFL